MKILVMSSVYPCPTDNENHSITPVVHYFCKQCKDFGHEVVVIYNANRYPRLFQILQKKIIELLMSKFSFVPLVNKKEGDQLYYLDGIKVFKIPLLKLIPRGPFFKTQIKKQTKKIISFLKEEK